MSIDAAAVQHDAHIIEEAATHGSSAAVTALRAEDLKIRQTEGANSWGAKEYSQAVMAQLEKDHFLPALKFDIVKMAGEISGHDSTTVREQYNSGSCGQNDKGSCGQYVGRGIQHVSANDISTAFPVNPATLEGLIAADVMKTVSFNDCGGHDIRRDSRPALPEVSLEQKNDQQEKEPSLKEVMAQMKKLQEENAALKKLIEGKSGKDGEPKKDEPKKDEPKKDDPAARKDEEKSDAAKRLEEAKKLVEEDRKQQEEAKRKEEEKRQESLKKEEEKKSDHAKRIEEAKKLLEDEKKLEEAKRKGEEPKSKPDAPAQPKTEEDKKKPDAPAQPKAEEEKKKPDVSAQPKDETIGFNGRDAENVKSVVLHRNDKGELVSKDYEFNRPYWDINFTKNCKTSATVYFDAQGQEDKIVHRYDNGWIYTSFPKEKEHGHLYVQRPACTKDEDPLMFERNAKAYGTIDYKRDSKHPTETFALTKQLLVDGIHQLDVSDITYLPGGFHTYYQFGDW